MPGAATALAAVRRRVGGWLRTAVDYVFGYDYFISYGHRDGKNYPSRLWDLLTASGFKVCLDDREFLFTRRAGGGQLWEVSDRGRLTPLGSFHRPAAPPDLGAAGWLPFSAQILQAAVSLVDCDPGVDGGQEQALARSHGILGPAIVLAAMQRQARLAVGGDHHLSQA